MLKNLASNAPQFMAQPPKSWWVDGIEVNNFRGAESLRLRDLGRSSLLTGLNGTGKTTTEDAIRYVLLGSIRDEYANRIENAALIGPYGDKTTITIWIALEYDTPQIITASARVTATGAEVVFHYKDIQVFIGKSKEQRATFWEFVGNDPGRAECALDARTALGSEEFSKVLSSAIIGTDVTTKDLAEYGPDHAEFLALNNLGADPARPFDVAKRGEEFYTRRTGRNARANELKTLIGQELPELPKAPNGRVLSIEDIPSARVRLAGLSLKREGIIREQGAASACPYTPVALATAKREFADALAIWQAETQTAWATVEAAQRTRDTPIPMEPAAAQAHAAAVAVVSASAQRREELTAMVAALSQTIASENMKADAAQTRATQESGYHVESLEAVARLKEEGAHIKTCPMCAQALKGKALEAFKAANAEEIAQQADVAAHHNEERAKAEAARDAARSAAREADTRYWARKEELDALLKEATAAQQTVDRLENEHANAIHAATESAKQALGAAQTVYNNCKAQITRIETEIKGLDAMKPGDLERIARELAEVDEDMRRGNDVIGLLEAHAKNQDLQAELGAVQGEIAHLDWVVGALYHGKFTAAMVEKRAGAMLENAGKVLGRFGYELHLRVEGKKVIPQMRRNGQDAWRPVAQCSGAEQVMAHLALGSYFANGGQILIDRGEGLDVANRPGAMAYIKGMQAGGCIMAAAWSREINDDVKIQVAGALAPVTLVFFDKDSATKIERA